MSGPIAAHPASAAPPHHARPLDTAAWLNLAMAAMLWGWLASELWFEWSVSEQYGYGLFIPFLTAYLLWLRLADRPAPQPWGKDGPVFAFLGFVALAQYPIAVIFAANADWRLLAWIETLLALAASILLLLRWGGWPWVRHFLPALALFLFAVPWPSYIEISLVDHLMTFVATIVAEVLNLLGYDALRQGHIIQLPGSYVSVEEACSGVRSIQSTIMAAWLVGEWWRFRPLGRAGLLAWGMFVAMLFNLLRTLSLAWLDAAQGPATMEHWHDTAGYLVFGLSFATVLLGAWRVRPRLSTSTEKSIPTPPPHWLPAIPLFILLVLLLGAWPFCAAWYALRAPDVSQKSGWRLDLASAAPNAKVEQPLASIRQSLFYDEGFQSTWKDADGHAWSLYNLQWDHGRAAQLGGVHSPESCLPAVGWVQLQQGDNLDWRRGGLELIFNTYEFAHSSTRLFVFYCQWDPAGYEYYEKTGRFRADRLIDAWHADRKQGKQLLEIAIDHAPSLAAATALVQKFLDAGIVELPPGGKIRK
jgi:exosortase